MKSRLSGAAVRDRAVSLDCIWTSVFWCHIESRNPLLLNCSWSPYSHQERVIDDRVLNGGI